MVGSAVVRALASKECQVLTATRDQVDLRRQADTERLLAELRPDLVFLAAAHVGGILANDSRPGEFLYDNLMIEANVIHAARSVGVEKLLFLGSSCIYPKLAPQPIEETALLTGSLEPTNQWYAVAKIAGLKLVEAYRRQYGCNFISLQPANLYGPGDNFDFETSHVIAALVRRFDEAKRNRLADVVVWGTGTPRREFLHVDDLAAACIFAMQNYDGAEPLNVGSGLELTIAELAELVARTVGYQGQFTLDPSKPDGTPRKLLDSSRASRLGWRPTIGLAEGLRGYYASYLASIGEVQSSLSAA
jgi:GDP-L-fucose synthase